MNIIKRIFSFGRSYDEFELLETEGGQPSFFGSAGRAHKDAAGAIENANDTINCDVSANEERLKTEMHAEINPDMVMRRFLLCGQIEALAVPERSADAAGIPCCSHVPWNDTDGCKNARQSHWMGSG